MVILLEGDIFLGWEIPGFPPPLYETLHMYYTHTYIHIHRGMAPVLTVLIQNA